MIILSCASESGKNKNSFSKAIEITEESLTPTVRIEKYTLIERDGENRKNDAAQILDLKRKWPLVMQSPNRTGFDTILSQHFTFTENGHVLNREEYITDRTKPSDWKITFVKYDNLALQFFGTTALLTYRNQVTNENIHTKEIETEFISWADIYVREDEKWKIGASHTVDIRVEKK